LIILKLGGGAAINLEGVADDIAGLDQPLVVVHGANAYRDQLAERLGITLERVTSLSGVQSVLTREEAIEVMLMAYAGVRNKRLVELLQQRGVNAVGLTGLDGRLIQAKRNPGIRTRRNGKNLLLRDLTGRPQEINTQLLHLLLDNGYLPVLTVPLVDENGFAVSSENDDVVALLQASLGAERVVHLIEAGGLLPLDNPDAAPLDSLTHGQLQQLVEQATGRIKRKLMAIEKIIAQGAQEVVIADGRCEHPLTAALDGLGTVIT